ncbi:ABC transporter permease [Paenibacillus cymbidii]|uniref:ABC transporter permease n=1 Tax=Paenibacillus cymbidii TaxID=1639034 RepID=UPI001081DBF1|nr:ABC-2 family transporter protein [Paenibacillus cymbidii]
MLRLYVQLARASLRGQMQYKFNFIFSSVMVVFMFGIEFATIGIVVARFGGIKGWDVYQVGYLFAIMMFVRAFYRMLAGEVNYFEKYLVEGNLDQLLLRPVPVLLVLTTRQFRPMLGELVLGGATIAICIGHMIAAEQVTWIAIPLTAVVVVSGTTILFAIGLATATVGFWTHRIDDLQRMTDDAASTASRLPLTIYPGWLRIGLLTVVPTGFAAYVPSLYVIRHEAGVWVLLATLAVAGVLLAGALKFWRFGIAHYQSTGT